MCHYTEILGSGDALTLQLLTVCSIAVCIAFWVWLYLKNGLERELKAYALPIALWTVMGTLDIVITAKGTYMDPLREGNPLAELVFVKTGFLGPVIASILWISLWAGIVLAINRMKVNHAGFFSLAIFWSLATGHLLGFSSWFIPFCGFNENYALFLSGVPRYLKHILFGCFAASLHYPSLHRYLTAR